MEDLRGRRVLVPVDGELVEARILGKFIDHSGTGRPIPWDRSPCWIVALPDGGRKVYAAAKLRFPDVAS